MKKFVFLFFGAILFFYSCKKNASPSTPTIDATKYYLSSVRNYTPGAVNIDSFTYNSGNLLTKYVQYAYQTSGGTTLSDSLTFVFSYSGSSPVPSSYTFSQPSQGTIDELHQLSYDGQNRVTKDFCPSRSDFFTNYTYPGSNEAGMLQFSSSGLDNQVDTLFFTNGNMTSQVIYFPNDAGTADSLEGTVKVSYSSYGNPAYHPEIANTIGHLLFILSFDGFQDFVDFNSKNFASSVTDIEPGQPNLTIKYNISTDSKGRISGTGYAGFPSSYSMVYSYY
jgi:hypothetical protein